MKSIFSFLLLIFICCAPIQNKDRLDIDEIETIEIQKNKVLSYRLNSTQTKDFVDYWNTSKSKGLCKYMPKYNITVQFKSGKSRKFRINANIIKEENDYCFEINNKKFFNDVWSKLSRKNRECNYINFFKNKGNTQIDTITVGRRVQDPVDEDAGYEEVQHGFFIKGNKVFKKARTHRRCNGKFIDVYFYQDFSRRIDLASYQEYNDVFFTTNNKVYFWWVNSDGHLMYPINNANPKTFKPFENICGGVDDKGVYYGCPSFGVYTLSIPVDSKFEFIPKEDNYWNSPSHYVIVDDKVYNINWNIEKGYFIELNETISVDKVKRKNNKK